ncbi:MAG: hypothetical protein KGL39_39450 [Patescibacteria group bacterium]|nr:hypothetical protein [Patescibacteria group bacterium]
MKGEAKQLVSLWPNRKIPNMMSGEIAVADLENLLKAATVGGKKAIKFLAFKNETKTGRTVVNILAEPCDPYEKGKAKGKNGSWGDAGKW